MKNKKGSMELSVNSIVILVIAIVMLGLILGFVKSKFSDLDKQVGTNEPEPAKAAANSPLTVSRTQLVVDPGEETYLKIGAFAAAKIEGKSPSLKCGENEWLLDPTTKTIEQGKSDVYSVVVKVPSDETSGKKICTISIEGVASKDLMVQVN